LSDPDVYIGNTPFCDYAAERMATEASNGVILVGIGYHFYLKEMGLVLPESTKRRIADLFRKYLTPR
jgi:hypothetical protein